MVRRWAGTLTIPVRVIATDEAQARATLARVLHHLAGLELASLGLGVAVVQQGAIVGVQEVADDGEVGDLR